MKLDSLDLAILRLLEEDARLSFREIARRTGTTTPTVSARVATLRELGVIRGFHANVAWGPRKRRATPPRTTDAAVPCHQCKGPIHGLPVRGRFAGRAHVFCCTECRDAFAARLRRIAEGAQAARNR